jgi:ribosomal protein S27AE
MSTVRDKRCPKCDEGTLSDGPRYTVRIMGDEGLLYRCTRCGYGEFDPTKDAKTQEQAA